MVEDGRGSKRILEDGIGLLFALVAAYISSFILFFVVI